MHIHKLWLAGLAALNLAAAQYFPPTPQGMTTAQTQLGQVSYTQVRQYRLPFALSDEALDNSLRNDSWHQIL